MVLQGQGEEGLEKGGFERSKERGTPTCVAIVGAPT